MQRITPMLWFDNQAEEAANFYVSVFKNSKVKQITHYAGEDIPEKKGQVMTVAFELNGQEFTALNGGPGFKFTQAISFVVNCQNQEEGNVLLEKLSAHPESEQCGWLKDKFGLSWQIVPKQLGEKLGDKDAKKAGSVMQAMLQMKKIDIKKLKQAYGQD